MLQKYYESVAKMLQGLQENDGLTLKKYTAITYKSGWQVADCGVEVRTLGAAIEAVISCDGSCGVWYSNGSYYIDHSYRVATKAEALRIGKLHNQISVLRWKGMKLVYCNE